MSADHPSRRPRPRSAQRPAERTRRGDPARLAAYTVLRRVAEGAYTNLELPKVLREKRIGGRDAAFATELVHGTTRMRGLYDVIIGRCADRPLDRIDAGVLDALRLGVHQLLGMRVPSHAAVDETVALARQVNGIGSSGFVNAVLRRVGERGYDEWVETVTADLDSTAALAVRTSHPEWVVRALRAALIGHGACTKDFVDEELATLLAADNDAPQVHLVARPGLVSTRELIDEAEPGQITAGRWSPTAMLLGHGDPGAFAAIRDHRAAVQDEGSQLIALALAAGEVEGRDARWLDLCAGPGGKAGLLAALAAPRGAQLVANEVSAHRADLVRQSLSALAPQVVQVRVGDGRAVGQDESSAYDRVLVDAPCTGLGALRRRAEARWRRQPTDLAVLSALQRELLSSALMAVRPGGLVAYATCSPHLSETRFVVDDVVKKLGGVEVLDARPVFVEASQGRLAGQLGEGLHVQLWPHRHGTDAMFCALLRRTAL